MQPYPAGFEYSVLCKRWKSQLEFFGMETAFLYDLFDRYAINLLCNEYYEKLKQAGHKLPYLERYNNELQQQLSHQLCQLGIQMQKGNVTDIKPMPYDQGYMERSVNKLINEYHELFNVMEAIMHKKRVDRGRLNMRD